MSTLKVEVVKIDEVLVHPNADRLELARVKGWNVVVGKGNFQEGHIAVYFPIDSVLPKKLEEQLFPPDSKIKLHKSRIRTIKIRGAISQGMLVPISELRALDHMTLEVGDDVTSILGVTKYEPHNPDYQAGSSNKPVRKGNPNFNRYTNIENIKNYNNVFTEGEWVWISEKLHGTSARYGYVERYYEPTFFGKLCKYVDDILTMLGWCRTHEFVYGSRNVQLSLNTRKENIYLKVGKQENFQQKLKDGECVYGEIVGYGIQKGYSYGCSPGEYKFFAYDVSVDGRWLNYAEFLNFCRERKITTVPCLYVGPYSKEIELKHRDGDSTIGGQKVREGVIVKPLVEAVASCGRKVLKSISDAYYLNKDNSDYH